MNYGSTFKEQSSVLETVDRFKSKRNTHQNPLIGYETKYQKLAEP